MKRLQNLIFGEKCLDEAGHAEEKSKQFLYFLRE